MGELLESWRDRIELLQDYTLSRRYPGSIIIGDDGVAYYFGYEFVLEHPIYGDKMRFRSVDKSTNPYDVYYLKDEKKDESEQQVRIDRSSGTLILKDFKLGEWRTKILNLVTAEGEITIPTGILIHFRPGSKIGMEINSSHAILEGRLEYDREGVPRNKGIYCLRPQDEAYPPSYIQDGNRVYAIR